MLEYQERGYEFKAILTLNVTDFFPQLSNMEHMT